MQKKEIIYHLIKVLSDKDRRSFRRLIRSNSSTKKIDRCETLLAIGIEAVKQKKVPLLNNKKIIRKLSFSTLKKLDEFTTEFIELLKYFYVSREIKHRPVERLLLLHKALVRRKENSYLDLLHQEIREYFIHQHIPTAHYHLQQAEFYSQLYIHPNNFVYQADSITYLNRSETKLEIGYWIQKLKITLVKANKYKGDLSKLAHVPKELPNLRPYIEEDKTNLLRLFAAVYPYIHKPPSQKDIRHILHLAKEQTPLVYKEDKEIVVGFLLNKANRTAMQNRSDIKKNDVYLVLKTALQEKWFVQHDGYILFEDFINALTLARSTKDTEFLVEIEDEYQDYMHESHQPYIITMARAYNFFLHQQWEKVIDTFDQVKVSRENKHRFFFLAQRNTFSIQALFHAMIYDKQEIREIDKFLEKHQRYMKRNQAFISESRLTFNNNFIRTLRKLHRYLIDRNHKLFATQKEQIQTLEEWHKDFLTNKKDTLLSEWIEEQYQHLAQEIGVAANN